MTAQLEAPSATTRLLFVGQRRSKRAEAIGATWENGGLAACTLWKALNAIGLDPCQQRFMNIWQCAEPLSPEHEAAAEASALAVIRDCARSGYAILGMGAVVQQWLNLHGLPHTPLIHPAARGAIRRSERYQRHVAEVLRSLGVVDGEAA